MIDALRNFTPKFMQWEGGHPQVKSVLSKILLCRTSALKGHLYKCLDCESQIHLYNSCTDRHCPQCGGARRADWLAKSEEVIVPRVPYFQVVFTLPDKLSALILGNRSLLYDLLFRSAWQALDGELRRTAKFQPAALMVLHTWNQQLDHHPHVHALVPGGGPSLDATRWVTGRHRRHRRRRKPYLTDNVDLGRTFRKIYVRRLRKLFDKGQLRLGGSTQFLGDRVSREAWFIELERVDWNVFIQGPPQGESQPQQLAKYLAGYLTGGPIADRRLIHLDTDEVRFWARPKKSTPHQKANRVARPYRLSGRTFMQRWTQHILPKGFTRSRCYGGYHGSKRADYLSRCRELLQQGEPETDSITNTEPSDDDDRVRFRCPTCQSAMLLVSSERRPSWRTLFERTIYRPSIYSPQHHLGVGRSPPRPPP